jgi:hypothetical protein
VCPWLSEQQKLGVMARLHRSYSFLSGNDSSSAAWRLRLW